MLSIKSAEFFITTITFLLAYVLMVTIAGSFRAWVSEKMGDSSAADAGFLTLNPMQHVDAFGLAALFLFRFGWGAQMPVSPSSIVARTTFVRWVKLCLAYWSDMLAHIVLALVSMTALLVMFGQSVIGISASMMFSGELSHMLFAQAFPEHSSLTISLALVCVASIYLNVFLAVFNFVFRGLELFMIYLIERSPHYAQYNNIATVLLYALIVSIFVTPQLRVLFVIFIVELAQTLAHLFGGL